MFVEHKEQIRRDDASFDMTRNTKEDLLWARGKNNKHLPPSSESLATAYDRQENDIVVIWAHPSSAVLPAEGQSTDCAHVRGGKPMSDWNAILQGTIAIKTVIVDVKSSISGRFQRPEQIFKR